MITGRQIKQARKLLGWSVATLVAKTNIDDETILRAERTDDEPLIMAHQQSEIRRTLESAASSSWPRTATGRASG